MQCLYAAYFIMSGCSWALLVNVLNVNLGMLVVSSSEPEPVEQFLKLSQEQHRIQHSSEYMYPKWFIPNTLKYYVLLHDVSTGEEQRWVFCFQ